MSKRSQTLIYVAGPGGICKRLEIRKARLFSKLTSSKSKVLLDTRLGHHQSQYSNDALQCQNLVHCQWLQNATSLAGILDCRLLTTVVL